MRLTKSLIIAAVIALTACASGVEYRNMMASIPKLKADQGRIYFFRSKSIAGIGVQPSIELDGVSVGNSSPGGFFYVDAPAGTHEISSVVEVEKKITVTLGSKEIIYIKTTPGFGPTAGSLVLEVVSEAVAMEALPDRSYTGEAR